MYFFTVSLMVPFVRYKRNKARVMCMVSGVFVPDKYGTTTFSITTFSITTFSLTTLSITIVIIMTLTIMGLFVTLRINDTRHNGIMLKVVMLSDVFNLR
jgi:hypothetical protein